MRLTFKITLSILSVALILASAYLLLPSFATELARYELKQQGFTKVEIQIATIGLTTTDIEQIQLSNDDFRIELNGAQVDYELLDLLGGEAKRIHIESLAVYSVRDEARAKPDTLPTPALLSGFLSLAWHDYMPVSAINIDQLSFYSEDGAQALSATLELSKLGQHIRGEIGMLDYWQKPFQAELEISPETGIDIQMFSQNMHPLSIKLKPMQEADGLAGTLQLDLAKIAGMLGQPETLKGSLQANISYYSNSGSPETYFSVEASVAQLAFTDAKIKTLQARLEGQVTQKGKTYQFEFFPASQIELLDFQQGQNTLQRLQTGLPKFMSFAEGNLKIEFDPETQIALSELNMAPFSAPQMRIENLELAVFATNDNAQACLFKMRLTSPLLNIDDQRIDPGPVQIEGHCPDRNTQIWSINAESDKIGYESPDYLLSLNHCQVTVGNSDQGTRLDPDPAELGGTFICDSSLLSSAINAQFRFNPQNSTGRADFSISDITPDAETPLFSSLLKEWSQPFELVSGALSVEGQYRWWQNSQGLSRDNLTVDLNVISAGGHYEGILFSGLNYHDSIEVLPTLKSSEFSILSVEDIDIAVPITQASASIRFSPSSIGDLPVLEIDKMRLSLLNGTVVADRLELDLNDDQQDLLFRVHGLDLAPIIAMQQLDGLAATGLLDGTVPVTITPEGIGITDGKINAQHPGGQIQYIPSSETTQTRNSLPGSDLVLRILENLYYNSLLVNVDYAEDGQLTMELAIQGKSPQVDANRPIHFNLTLEQNLLTLLKGLRYAQGISDDIDKKVRKYYSEKENTLN